MLLWIIFAMVVLCDSKVHPGIFYFPSEEDSLNPSGSSRPRTFFKNSSLSGLFSCRAPAVESGSNYTVSIWTFKTGCFKLYNDQVTRNQVSGIVNFLLNPSAENKHFIQDWKRQWDERWIRCYEYDITCSSYNPGFVRAKRRFCKGYQQYRKMISDVTEEDTGSSRKRRDTSAPKRRDTSAALDTIKEFTKGDDKFASKNSDTLINITKTGAFYIGWQVKGSQNSPVDLQHVELTVLARDTNLNSYLEAKDYPLLIFYGVLSGVYALLALIWLVVCGCHYRDILQVQVWIGGMLALNMIEMSVFCSKYQQVNNGKEVTDGLVVFAELLSTFKHALSRVLVLVICMGYGIVKPRLGSTKHLVFALGLAYCLFLSIDGIYNKLVAPAKPMTQRQRLYAFIPRAVVNAILIWWIIASLVSTIRTLRMRRNVIKLTLYRHFSNALAFSILSCVGFEVWWIHLTKEGCVKNWREYWLSDDIFWNLIFTMILMVIMFLWRPTVNNSRYAFSPLLDTDEEESEETINEAFEGMKMRNIKKKESSGNIEDDLKWVEENIPSTLGDTVFEKLMDSEEEVEHRKYEMSKMQ